MKTPNVCFVVNSVGETSVPADIAVALTKFTDVEVDIITWFDAKVFDLHESIEIIPLNAPDTTLGIDRRTCDQTNDVLAEYDLIQVHHNHSGSFAKLIARLSGVPVVSREGNTRDGFTRLGRVANGLTNPLADAVVCNSRAVYESFRRWEDLLLSDEKIAFIPNGVDFDRLAAGEKLEWSAVDASGADPDATLVGTAAMLTEQKSQRTLIDAIARARSDGDRPIELLIAGDGPLRRGLEERARDLDVDHAVHFLGYCERLEVYKMLSEIDVYAMPSRWEGFSAAAVEALASGTPAVFSDIPPFREPYDDVARFHPVGDHVSLASELVDLAATPDKRRELGATGRALVERKYKMDRVATQYRDLYEAVLG